MLRDLVWGDGHMIVNLRVTLNDQADANRSEWENALGKHVQNDPCLRDKIRIEKERERETSGRSLVFHMKFKVFYLPRIYMSDAALIPMR